MVTLKLSNVFLNIAEVSAKVRRVSSKQQTERKPLFLHWQDVVAVIATSYEYSNASRHSYKRSWDSLPEYLFTWSSEFLGTFAYSRKVPVNRRVCPSVSTYQRGFHWTEFYEIWYWQLLRQFVEKIRFFFFYNRGAWWWGGNGALYMETEIRFIVSGDIDSPEKRCCATVSVYCQWRVGQLIHRYPRLCVFAYEYLIFLGTVTSPSANLPYSLAAKHG